MQDVNGQTLKKLLANSETPVIVDFGLAGAVHAKCLRQYLNLPQKR